MNNKGFTMVELLAIITILVTILLVSFPTLINMTRHDKEKQYNDMVNTLCKAGETYIYDNEELFPELGTEGKKNYVEIDTLIDSNLVDGNTKNPKTKTNVFGRLEYTVMQDKSLKCTYHTDLCYLVEDVDKDKEISVGDKYTCDVNYTDSYNFYVLSIEGNKVNLIMDRNICEDGTTNYDEDPNDNYCRYAWHLESSVNNYGPITAMQVLYNATKEWANVPDMDFSGDNEYRDENNKTDSTRGYVGIRTSNKVTTIIGNDGNVAATIGTTILPLKSRMPKKSEIMSENSACDIYNTIEDSGTCATFLIDNLRYKDVSTYTGSEGVDKYSINSANISGTTLYNILGYWLLSSASNSTSRVNSVYYYGYLADHINITVNDSSGIRPVITINKFYLNNQ